MHYFQFNIGDYKSHTSHLTPMEDLVYRRLLDWYYLHEKPISLNSSQVARYIALPDHQKEVDLILEEFFTKTEEGWINKRADKEISVYKGFSESGKKGAAIRWSNGANSPPNSPPNAGSIANNNHEPLTINQKPLESFAPKRKTKTRLPEVIEPTEEHLSFVKQHDLNISDELESFRLYHEAKLTTSGNWNSSFSTWLRNAVKFRKPNYYAKQDSLKRTGDLLTGRTRDEEHLTIDMD